MLAHEGAARRPVAPYPGGGCNGYYEFVAGLYESCKSEKLFM